MIAATSVTLAGGAVIQRPKRVAYNAAHYTATVPTLTAITNANIRGRLQRLAVTAQQLSFNVRRRYNSFYTDG